MTFKVKAGLQVGSTTVVDSNSIFQQTEAAAPVSPSLVLNFTTKMLDPRITFARGSTATYVASNGYIQTAAVDTPRFNHDPITRRCKGLLIEPYRANLLAYSNDWTQYHSIDNATITANTVMSPDGTMGGATLTSTLTGGVNNCNIQKIAGISPSTNTYQYTLFVKQGTSPKVSINLACYGGTYKDIIVTLNWADLSVTYGGTDFANGSYTLEAFPNGWYRFGTKLTDNNSAGQYLVVGRMYVRDQGTSNVSGEYTYLWGAQIEVGNNASTSYIPTGASSAARNTDVAYMQGNNFFSWYNSDEGSFVLSIDNTVDTTITNYPRILSFTDGNAQYNNIHVIYSSPQIQVGLWTNGVFQVGDGVNKANTANTVVAMAYKLNNTGASFDGSVASLDTSCPIPIVKVLYLGGVAASFPMLGHIKHFTYYPERLSGSVLTNLTS